MPTCRGAEERSARRGSPEAALRPAWRHATARSAPTGLASASSASGWPGSSRRFFSTDRALDRSRMHLQAERVLDQLCQLARPDRLARSQPRLEKGQHLALEFVRAARAPFLGNKPRYACRLEVRLRLIKGWAGDAVFVGYVGHRRLLYGHPSQHL